MGQHWVCIRCAADKPCLVTRDTCIESNFKRGTDEMDKWFWHVGVSIHIEGVGIGILQTV